MHSIYHLHLSYRMHMNRYFWLSLFILAHISTTYAGRTFHLENVVTSNEVKESIVSAFHQDSKGFVYIGTNNGLFKYDGHHFLRFNSIQKGAESDRLMYDHLMLIREDSLGYLWTVTKDGRLYRFDKNSEQFYPIILNDLSNEEVIASYIYISPQNHLWITTRNSGCFQITYAEEASLTIKYFDKKSVGCITRMEFGAGNELYAMGNSGISVWSEGSQHWSKIEFPGKLRSDAVATSFKKQDDTVLFGTNQGDLFMYNPIRQVFSLIAKPFDSPITQVEMISGNYYAALSKQEGIFIGRIDNGHEIARFKTAEKGVRFADATRLKKDLSGDLWAIADSKDVIRYSTQTNQFERLSLNSKEPYLNIAPGGTIVLKNNMAVFHLMNGEICYFDEQHNRLELLTGENGHQQIPAIAHRVMLDHQENLWLSTFSREIHKFAFREIGIRPTRISNRTDQFSNEIRSICQDHQNKIWLGTREGQICLVDEQHQLIGYLSANGTIQAHAAFSESGIYALAQDGAGNIWAGSRDNGLYRITPFNNHYSVTHFAHHPDNPYSLNNNSIFSLHVDSQDRLWIGTWGGGLNYIATTEQGEVRFIHQGNELSDFPTERFGNIRSITSDKNGNIWAAGQQFGVIHFQRDSVTSSHFRYYSTNPQSDYQLTSDKVLALHYSEKYGLLVGTSGGGINRFPNLNDLTQTPILLNSQNVLSSNIIEGIAEDNAHNIWLATLQGIVRLDLQNNRTEQIRINGQRNTFTSTNTIIVANNGNLFAGTSDGLLNFNPAMDHSDTFIPSIHFTKFALLNDKLKTDEVKGFDTHIDNSTHITLKQNSSAFDLECVALDYAKPENIRYAYKLNGIDKEWNYIERNRTMHFRNLPAGTFNLLVKSTNSDGIWVENTRSLVITILPPFWKTNTAIFLYLLLLIGLILLGSYILHAIYMLKNRVAMEREIAEMKLNFFTHISHEIRTPLTLIHTPLEHIISSRQLDEKLMGELQGVYGNSERLLKMVNQLLDFRSIQNKKLSLHLVPVNVEELAKKVVTNFEQTAIQCGVYIGFENKCSKTVALLDAEKLETVFYNLVGNSLKFTKAGKQIILRLRNEDERLICEIEDQGIGMNEVDLSRLFDPFQRSAPAINSLQNGSGIGMTIVKEYCDLMNISLQVKSSQGEGTTVTLNMELDKTYVLPLTDIDAKKTDPVRIPLNQYAAGENARKTILVIEDNVELRILLASILRTTYEVIEAADGEIGIRMACEMNPDLILTDLMMPNVSGFGVAESLKREFSTSHIPIVVVSAQSDNESRKRLMELGVEDLFAKPFNAELLMMRIANILETRQRLRVHFSSNLSHIPTPTATPEQKDGITQQDLQLLETINIYLNANIELSTITVYDLSEATGLSYHILNNKLKQLVGMTPLDYIREFRIQLASQLIRGTDLNIKEVAYKVGFSDPKYFSRCFKQRFESTPMEYKQKCNV